MASIMFLGLSLGLAGVAGPTAPPDAAALVRQVREREAWLDAIIAQSGDGIIASDEHGVLRLFNPAAERQHGAGWREVAAPEWVEAYGLRALDGRPLALEETPLYRALHGERVEDARWLVRRPGGDVTDTRWRYSLLNWGHDPLK